MKIGIVGAGSWGTALAILLNNNAHDVVLWSSRKNEILDINQFKENKKYLPNIKINDKIILSYKLSDLKDIELIVLAVPSNAVREVCENFKETFEKKIIVNVSKGIEEKTLLTLSQVIKQILPNSFVATLSGPSHAEEVARNIATACVVSAYDKNVAKIVQDIFMNDYFRVYINMDIIGVELGGAVKNLIALAVGACDGCGFGDNTKAALMTRGLAEITRLGVKMGAKAETFSGLTGIGDLIVTCTSEHSRNRRAGFLLGEGKKLDDVLNEIGMVIEGLNNAKSINNLANKFNVDMPITKEIYNVVFNNKNIKDSVASLMMRDKKIEL